jgi:hypothetical protein
MTIQLVAVAILLFFQPSARIIARECLHEFCATISVDDGNVMFRESEDIVAPYKVGPYIKEAHRLVPSNEAPFRDITAPNMWRVVATAYLNQYDDQGPLIRVRLFDRRGRLRKTYSDGNHFLDDLRIGRLFGTSDIVLAIQTGGMRSYLQHTAIWLISEDDRVKQLVDVRGALESIQTKKQDLEHLPGVWIGVETFDGVNAETRGRQRRFFLWNQAQKTLSPH